MDRAMKTGRRTFFKQAAGAIGTATQITHWPAFAATAATVPRQADRSSQGEIAFPRLFTGKQLQMLAFPLGGVGAGGVALGGRGQLRDWQIFNKPNQGGSLSQAFPSIWIQSGGSQPVARVLEGRILAPYEGQNGLDANNCPGLSRIETVEFTGAYPLAHLQFKDASLPVSITLDAFSPFIPHDPDASGLPVAILRYRVTNPGRDHAKVGIAFSIDNPVYPENPVKGKPDTRVNEYRSASGLEGLLMSNPGLAQEDPMHGTFVIGVLPDKETRTTHWRGWPKKGWWSAPMLYWDAFSRDGELLNEPAPFNTVGALCQQQSIAPGGSAEFTFLLAWHFPNRTPDRCGWTAPAGEGGAVIGNYYATKFKNAWEVAEYTATNLQSLEARTRTFTDAFAASTLPAVVKEAASANLSTLASTTCFRTADGEFHGFEGAYDHTGSCFGNCLHVWNYETATAFLFPSYARSLRESAFGYNMDDGGAMHLRQLLPDGKQRQKLVAADGQMGQIIHAYLDWKLCGDAAWLKTMWPRVKMAIEYAWIPAGWDADHDGVLEGAQANTYDVEFHGPNPLCGIYYLGALRAAEEMARAVGDESSATEYRRLFEKGSRWIDLNLFQGEFYIQQIRIAPGQGQPEYQVGEGCLIDQLTGQYLAHVAGLGPLISPQHARTTLESIYKYNYKRTLVDHDCVQRTYALNDEPAVVVCDYGKADRPHIPFPYYSEAWTGLEHSTAALMFYCGMIPQGTEYIENVRARFDGVRRNPWDECEAGHHYVRAMASWSGVVALSGFHYAGDRAHVIAIPPIASRDFRCFWATGTGWGTYSLQRAARGGVRFQLTVLAGSLPCSSCELDASGSQVTAKTEGNILVTRAEKQGTRTMVRFADRLQLAIGQQLAIDISA
jgi:non-lysosomal glucosylceramidase